MPKNGLPINEALKYILSLKPSIVSRGTAFNSLKKSLEDIEKKRKLIQLENIIDFIKNHCMNLKSDVQ